MSPAPRAPLSRWGVEPLGLGGAAGGRSGGEYRIPAAPAIDTPSPAGEPVGGYRPGYRRRFADGYRRLSAL